MQATIRFQRFPLNFPLYVLTVIISKTLKEEDTACVPSQIVSRYREKPPREKTFTRDSDLLTSLDRALISDSPSSDPS